MLNCILNYDVYLYFCWIWETGTTGIHVQMNLPLSYVLITVFSVLFQVLYFDTRIMDIKSNPIFRTNHPDQFSWNMMGHRIVLSLHAFMRSLCVKKFRVLGNTSVGKKQFGFGGFFMAIIWYCFCFTCWESVCPTRRILVFHEVLFPDEWHSVRFHFAVASCLLKA